MRFSQRYGYRPVKDAIQKESIDEDLRNRLWNCLDVFFWDEGKGNHLSSVPRLQKLCYSIWNNYFKRPVDTLDSWFNDTYKVLRHYFFNCAWHDVYDFIEFVANAAGDTARFQATCNLVLESEVSAYRFIDGNIVEITSSDEIESVEQALEETSHLANVQLHLKTGLDLLADRSAPDYRNSIKESISAVEALCNLIVGSKTTLPSAIRKLSDSGVAIHPALEDAFSKMYGYTSDADGIRHALMNESSLGFEDAKFMLVSCSAFVNYLLAKSARAGVPI